jgi:cytoskeletal protein CcmA (bactofilin family)
VSTTMENNDAMSSVIGTALQINGDVTSDGDIRIEGTIVGDVKSRTLHLGQSGEVQGEVIADQIEVSGRIVGQIKARIVSLTRSASVEGDILHETLSVDAGAKVDGAVRRISTQDLNQKAGPAKVSPISPDVKERPSTEVGPRPAKAAG